LAAAVAFPSNASNAALLAGCFAIFVAIFSRVSGETDRTSFGNNQTISP